MASFAAPGVLGLGAGAVLYNFGYQGQYKEDVAVASTAALTVFAVLAVANHLLGSSTTAATSAGETKKKKKNKVKKAAVAESDDSDSPNTEKAPKPKGDAGSAKGNKAEKSNKAEKGNKAEKAEKATKGDNTEKPSKGKAKEEKKEATQQPDKKGDKQNAKAKVAETSKIEQKANTKNAASKDGKKGGEAAKEAKKGEANSKEVKKGQAAKAVETGKKAKKQEVSSDSDDDEEAFLRLGQKSSGSLPTSRAPVVQAESTDDEDSDEDDTPAKVELSNSKSAIRRRKQKENKEKAVAVAAADTFNKPKKAVVDKDGFETVPVTKRPAKKPVAAAAAFAGSESKSEAKAAAPINFSDTIEMESKQIGLLVGPQGNHMKSLIEACGGNIRIDTPARDTGDKKVTVSGDEQNVKLCLKQIRELITKGYCSILSPGTASSNMTVPAASLGVLVGPKGATIQKIQDALKVKIKTPDRGSNSEQITISGPKDAVKKAKTIINQLIEHGFSSVTHEGYEVGEVAFPRAELRHLIGPGGHTIKSIQGDTKTKVKIPAEDAENQNIQVIGPADGVAKAIKQISTLLERKAAKEAAAADAAAYNSEDDGY